MANEYYDHSTTPPSGGPLSSSQMRAEFGLIEVGFDKLPVLTGNGGKPVFINSGGTAMEAVTLAAARTALGLAIGVNVQAYDTDLAAIAGLTSAADRVPYFTGAGTAALATFTAYGRSIVAVADENAFKALVNLEIGTDVQAYDADLAAVAALSSTGLIARTGAGTMAVRTMTQPAAGITFTNGDGVSGNPTLALANDLAALEGLGSTGIAVRTGTDNWAQRTITAGTGISVSNGNGVSGDPTVAIDTAVVARLNTEDQTLTGGVIVTSKSLGTISSGTVTPDPGDRPLQHYTNGGAHTLAPSSNTGSMIVDITNNGSAGAITTSGFTKVSGDSFTTTNGHKFRCFISIGNGGSLLSVQALQ